MINQYILKRVSAAKVLLAFLMLILTVISTEGQELYNHSKENPFAGYEEQVKSAVDNFKEESSFDAKVVTSYQYGADKLIEYVRNWAQDENSSGLLIAINPSDGNWEENIKVAYGQDLLDSDDYTASGIQEVVKDIMIPILEEEEITIIDDLGQEKKLSFGASIKYYKCVELGLAEILRRAPMEEVEVELPQVQFVKNDQQVYGFDKRDDQVPYGEYEQTVINEETVYVPWKSVKTGATDKVNARVETIGDDVLVDDVQFKTLSGIVSSQQGPNDFTKTLNLNGKFAGNVETLEAFYRYPDEREATLSKINVKTYDEKRFKLVVVPVDGNAYPYNFNNLRTQLNKTYNQAVVQWDVTLNNPVQTDLNPNEPFDDGGTGFLSNYTGDMRTVWRAFKDQYSKAEETFYLFLVSNPESGNKIGYMPKERFFGFVFMDNIRNEAQLIKTIGHELGHGAFNLNHPYSDYGHGDRATNNLMDYTDEGLTLKKYQWDNIHNPKDINALFQDEEDASFAPYEYLAGLNVVPGTFKDVLGLGNVGQLTFISSAGKAISIPPNARDVTFHNSGTLLAFTINEDGSPERYVGAQYTAGDNAGDFAGFLKEFGSSENYETKVYKDILSKELAPGNTKVYLGLLNEDASNDKGCGMDLFESEISLSDISGSYNTGGNKQDRVGVEVIKSKLLGSYSNSVNNTYGNKVGFLKTVDSPQACDMCTQGQDFFEDYKELTNTEADITYLTRVVQFICDNQASQTTLDILQAQIEKDFNENMNNIFWRSDRALYRKARNAFWEREDAWELYLKALERTANHINYFNEQLEANASKEDYYAAFYYLNDAFIAQMSVDERLKVLQTIFEHNVFITSSLFDPEKSDVGLIKKLLRSFDNTTDIQNFLSQIITDKERFKNDNRNVLFEVADALSDESMSLISVEMKLSMMEVMLDGSLFNLFGTNHDAIIAKVVSGVRDTDATKFFDELQSAATYQIDGAPLIYYLKNNLQDFLNPENPYTAFFKEIKRLSDARNRLSDGDIEVKGQITWNVEQKDYVLISLVRNHNDFTYSYNNDNHTVSIKTCEKYDYTYTYNGSYTRTCSKEVYLLPENSKPFDLVGVTILNDVSPFGRGCKDGQGNPGICGEMIYLPAIFIDYLDENVSSQRWKNFGWNTFNVVITVATFGEGAAAITAIRTAQAGTRVAVALKHSYTLLDFGYTVTTMTGQAFGVEFPKEWNYVGYLFAAKTSYDLLSKGGAKGLAYLKKASSSEKRKIIDEMGLNKNGQKMTEQQLDEFIDEADNAMRNSDSPEVRQKYQEALIEAGSKTPRAISDGILSRIDNPSSQFKSWVRSLEESPELLTKVDDLGGDVAKLEGDFKDLSKAIDLADADILSAWSVLKAFPEIRKVPGNLQTLKKVSSRFEYGGKDSYDGLFDLFNGSAASKQKLIDGLNKADEVFGSGAPVKYSGVKRGEVIILDGKSDEVARIIDGELEVKKTLDNGEVIGSHNGRDIIKKGDEVGFRGDFFNSVEEFAKTFDPDGKVGSAIRGEAFNYYKQEKWAKLEELFRTNNLNNGWPPANGGYNITDNVSIRKGMKFDRYQVQPFGTDVNGNPVLGGVYTSPVKNGKSYSFQERALVNSENDYALFYEIVVLKDLPFKTMDADVIPWHGHIGGGEQNFWKIPVDTSTGYPKTWNKLAEEGYIKITIKDSPNGQHLSEVGKVID